MARLHRPQLPPGPIDDLMRELHSLHARAGLPSTRTLARGQTFTHTTVHDVFTKTSVEPPKLPVLLRIVDQLAQRAPRTGTGTDVQQVLDEFDRLWRAADEEAASGRRTSDSSTSSSSGTAESQNDVSWHLDRVALPHRSISRRLHNAIGLGDLYPTYQPIYDPAGIIGRVEAYARCRMPDGGVTRGNTLIPSARRAGLLAELDTWVLCTAATDATDWPDVNGAAPGLVVNMSAAMGLSDLFEETIVEVVLSTGLEPSRL